MSTTAITSGRLPFTASEPRSATVAVGAEQTSASPRYSLERMTFWAVAVPLGLLDGLHWYLRTPPVAAAVVVLHVLVAWTLYPALVPLVRFVTRRHGFDSGTWPRRVPAHFLAALGFQYVHLHITQFLLVMLVRPLFLTSSGTARYYFPGLPPQHLREYPIDLLAYWIVVGFCYASHYRSALHQREIASARLETSLAEARLELLRRQLSPHFLFNTLNTISVLAQSGEQAAFLETMACLSKLLRVAVDETQPQTVALGDELQFLDGYLHIQQIRFGDRLSVQLNIDDASLNGLVPFMILQPLVENAIEHGICAEAATTSLITIESTVRPPTMNLRVCDGGPGFRSTPGPRTKRVGLANTESRLQQLYGDDHKIAYGQTPNGGACVTISIPFQQARPAAEPEGHP